MRLLRKQKEVHSLREVTYDYQRRMVKGKDRLEFGMDMYTLLYLK